MPERWRQLFLYILIALGVALLTVSVYFIGYESGWQSGILFNADAYFQGHCGFLPSIK
jgi:hypothetical protein